MRVHGRCFNCGRGDSVSGEHGDLSSENCVDCGFPLIAALDYFGERFQCLDCGRLYPIDDIRSRFEPRHDPAQHGIWCENCWPGTAPRSRKIDRRFEAAPRNLPCGDGEARAAVVHFKAYLEAMDPYRRMRRADAFERFRTGNLRDIPPAETRFGAILDGHDGRQAWHWDRQRILLDSYIVDFYSERAGLVVEIDGDDHAVDPKLYWDQVRDLHLREHGYEIIRFWNGTVESGAFDKEIRRAVAEVYDERCSNDGLAKA